MKKYIPILSAFLFLYFTAGALNRTDSTYMGLSSCIEKYYRYATLFPSEKVYLHLDNHAYYMGEKLWYKAYVILAKNNHLSPLSKVLYVELLSPDGRIIETQKLKITDGETDGCLDLQQALYSGFYEIRAYTRYMLNDDKEAIFSRVFPVFAKGKEEGEYNRTIKVLPPSQSIPEEREDYQQRKKVDVNFYPEGGDLVVGLTSQVAFKAFGKSGENLQVQGRIENEEGDTVVVFTTSYQGTGVFEFTPQAGKYVAKIQYGKREYKVDLPEILPLGLVMHVERGDDNQIKVLAQKSEGLPNEPLGFMISSRGKTYVTGTIDFGQQTLKGFSVPDSLLPTGVSQVILFDQYGRKWCERMFFVNHPPQVNFSVEKEKALFEPYEAVNLGFHIEDTKGKPLETSFSVSIRDHNTSTFNPYGETALTNLLLSSEVKGYIENPGYYFESNSLARRQALDLLMLTQGWSRYVWTKRMQVETERVQYPVEEFMPLEGRVLSQKRKRPPIEGVDVMMTLIFPDSTVQRGRCVTDSLGTFNLALQDYCGKADLFLQTKKDGKAKWNYIVLDRFFSPDLKTYTYAEKHLQTTDFAKCDSLSLAIKADTVVTYETTVTVLDTPDEEENDLPMDQQVHNINEVEVKAKKKYDIKQEGLRNASISYDVEQSINEMMDKDTFEPVGVRDYLWRVNPYFNIGSSAYKGHGVIYILNNRSTRIEPYLAQELSWMSMDEIETITIDEVTDPCIYLPAEACALAPPNMVLVFVYTNKRHDGGGYKTKAGTRFTNYVGYTCKKEFYYQDYSLPGLPEVADYRRTLYWNPNVQTDKEGNASVSFYNNSSVHQIDIQAETVTGDGQIGVLLE